MFYKCKCNLFFWCLFYSDYLMRKSVDLMGLDFFSNEVYEIILGGNGEFEDDDMLFLFMKIE